VKVAEGDDGQRDLPVIKRRRRIEARSTLRQDQAGRREEQRSGGLSCSTVPYLAESSTRTKQRRLSAREAAGRPKTRRIERSGEVWFSAVSPSFTFPPPPSSSHLHPLKYTSPGRRYRLELPTTPLFSALYTPSPVRFLTCCSHHTGSSRFSRPPSTLAASLTHPRPVEALLEPCTPFSRV
jgi:hypothetical protein